MIVTLALAVAAMPLAPPGQIVKGTGSIPESRNGPILPWKTATIPAVDWRCQLELSDSRKFAIDGTFHELEIVPSKNGGWSWAPYVLADVRPSDDHGFQGTYLATYSGRIYGFRFALDGDAYEITVRLEEGLQNGTAEVRRIVPVTERDWSEIGTGTCTAQPQPLKGASAS